MPIDSSRFLWEGGEVAMLAVDLLDCGGKVGSKESESFNFTLLPCFTLKTGGQIADLAPPLRVPVL